MSNELFSAFNFIEREDFIHKLDPRTKIIFVIIYTIIIFLYKQIIFQIFIFFSLIPYITSAHLWKTMCKSLKSMKPIFIFIIILNTIFGTLNLAVEMLLRLLNIIITFSIFFQTTPPDKLSAALIKMGIPFHIAFSVSLAFRFVPTIAAEADKIADAQKSRGMDFQEGGLFRQMKNVFPLIIPLILNSVRRAYLIAESLECRSFGIRKERTSINPLKLSFKDFFIIAINLLLFTFFISLKFNSVLIPNWFFYEIPV